MKRCLVAVMLVLCLTLCGSSIALGGLFDGTLTTPEPEAGFSLDESLLPSYSQYNLIGPDAETTLEDGSMEMTYELVPEEDFYGFGEMLEEMGWTVEASTPLEGGAELTLAKGEQHFSVRYSMIEYRLQLIYPAKTQYVTYSLAMDKQVEDFLAAGNYREAIRILYQKADANSLKRAHNLRYHELKEEQIAAGGYHTVGLKADGTVVAVGYNEYGQCEVSNWRGIVAIAAGYYYTVGLKADGTVVAVGDNGDGQCDVTNWKGIVAIAAGGYHTVGLKADGTVVAVGYNRYGQCDVSDWKGIVAIAATCYHTVGLKADGTVVAVGSNKFGQCDVSDWKGIVAIAAGDVHTVGLKADGTVVAVGDNEYGRCDVSNWRGIVAIAAGGVHTVGLKADGTVVAVGDNEYGRCDVSDWKGIVAIAAGGLHTVGLKADGTIVAVGNFKYGQCNVGDWKNMGCSMQLK